VSEGSRGREPRKSRDRDRFAPAVAMGRMRECDPAIGPGGYSGLRISMAVCASCRLDCGTGQAPHPGWTPGQRSPQEVSSCAIDDGERLLLFDPLSVPVALLALAREREPVIVLTAPWQELDAQAIVERLHAAARHRAGPDRQVRHHRRDGRWRQPGPELASRHARAVSTTTSVSMAHVRAFGGIASAHLRTLLIDAACARTSSMCSAVPRRDRGWC
jgi:hypothetical protein